jgi:hypothetical protein
MLHQASFSDTCCLPCLPCLPSCPCSPADLSIRKTPAKHQRMPSHEAILKVAKQHKLPAPELPGALAASQQQHQRQAAAAASAAATAAAAQRTAAAAASGSLLRRGVSSVAAAVGSSPPPAAAVPFRPCSSDGAQQSALAAAADADTLQQQAEAEAAYGEPWQSRKERVQLTSPHGRWAGVGASLLCSFAPPSAALPNLRPAPGIPGVLARLLTHCPTCPCLCRRPGWDLRCVIVKTGDDCRQELLAMQLIRALHEIFAEAQLPLWLKPYEVRACLGLSGRVFCGLMCACMWVGECCVVGEWYWGGGGGRPPPPRAAAAPPPLSSLNCLLAWLPSSCLSALPYLPSRCQSLAAGPADQQPHRAD